MHTTQPMPNNFLVILPARAFGGDHVLDVWPTVRFEHTPTAGATTMSCLVTRFDFSGKKCLFVLSEIADNEGASITNVHESLVPAVFRAMADCPAENALFVEHYGDFSYAGGREGEETFDWLITEKDVEQGIRSIGHRFLSRNKKEGST